VGIGTSSPTQKLDVTGSANVSGTVAMGSSFLRNRIINGAMQISQRTAVNTNVAVGTGLTGTFGPDRFYSYTGTASLWNTSQVTTGTYDFPYANRLQRIAGQTSTSSIYWRQIVETANCIDLAGLSVTLSFFATAGANYSGGAAGAAIYTGTAADQGTSLLNQALWTGFASALSSSFTPTATRTRYTFTATLGSTIQELAIGINWAGSGTAGANDYIDITGVQLEVGTVTTPFERRLYGQELVLCQRYYDIQPFTANAQSPFGYNSQPYRVVKRVAPTITTQGTLAGATYVDMGGTTAAAPNGYAVRQNSAASTATDVTLFLNAEL
jgi:hypothetical protein